MLLLEFGKQKPIKVIKGFKIEFFDGNHWVSKPRFDSEEPRAIITSAALTVLLKRVISYYIDKGHALISKKKLTSKLLYSYPHLTEEIIQQTLLNLQSDGIISYDGKSIKGVDKVEIEGLAVEYKIVTKLVKGKFWSLNLKHVREDLIRTLGMTKKGSVLFLTNWYFLLQFFFASPYLRAGDTRSFSLFCEEQLVNLTNYYVKDAATMNAVLQKALSDKEVFGFVEHLSYRGDGVSFQLLQNVV